MMPAQEKVDLKVVNRIRTEEFHDSKVMEHAFYLTDVHGPRLAGSPGYNAAAEWAMREMEKWGLINVRKEKFAFGTGWTNLRFVAHSKEPQYTPLIGAARPWSPGTNGPVSGQTVIAQICTDADMEKFKGKLRGKIVLSQQPPPMTPEDEPALQRYTDAELAEEAMAPDPSPRSPFAAPIPASARPRPGGCPVQQPFDREAANKFRNKVNKFLTDEGVLVAVSPTYRGMGGLVFSSAAGSRDEKDATPPPSVALTTEHYNHIARLVQHKQPVTLEFDIQNKYSKDTTDSFNVTAELPGGSRKDEIVMLGAHLDSWSFGSGATDNAAGCAVMMEAIRLLKALDLKMQRTVRIALWGGEEQGLLGSKAYVAEHFADPKDMKVKPEHNQLSGYFNFDNGTGKIRGVYLQGNDMMRPVFEAWLAPFKDLGASTVTIRNTGSTDHVSFDNVGLPGFQFIQDPVEYSTRTHHSNMDVYDRLQPADLVQASAIVASVVYHAATRDEMLPRKPLPKPQPEGERRRGRAATE
jgi:hypothetical protein